MTREPVRRSAVVDGRGSQSDGKTGQTQVAAVDTFTDAFTEGYSLGWLGGWQGGWLVGRDEERSAWNAIIGAFAETIKAPTHAEVARRRAEYFPKRCTAPGCRGCAQCIRAAAIESNLRRFGQPDYPGQAEAVAIVARRNGQRVAS